MVVGYRAVSHVGPVRDRRDYSYSVLEVRCCLLMLHDSRLFPAKCDNEQGGSWNKRASVKLNKRDIGIPVRVHAVF